MNLLLESLELLRDKKNSHPALMTHVVLGYPTLSKSIDIVKTMVDSGASFVELQIPFSDPMADGPTIMRACEEALANGVRTIDCMRAMEKLHRQVEVPLLFMSYYNLLFSYGGKPNGLKAFCRDARNAGAQGLIVPDVPPEEKEEGYWDVSRDYELLPVPLVSPVSSNARFKKIKKVAPDGFVYCVSTTGTTGARKNLGRELKTYLRRVKKEFKLPIAVGFGISDRSHVQAVHPEADIVVVGSATIDIIRKSEPKKVSNNVTKFISSLLK